MTARPKPLVLIVLDGFGERQEEADNAIRLARAPMLKAIFEGYPRSLIGTSGPEVGLPPGQMGNSEVGHLNLGAGRVVPQDSLVQQVGRGRQADSGSRMTVAHLFNSVCGEDADCVYGLRIDGIPLDRRHGE